METNLFGFLSILMIVSIIVFVIGLGIYVYNRNQSGTTNYSKDRQKTSIITMVVSFVVFLICSGTLYVWLNNSDRYSELETKILSGQ